MRIGVGEIWLVDPDAKTLRVFWLEGSKYREVNQRKGVFRSKAIEGFWIKVEWLWERPKEHEVLAKLLGWKI